jgi:hypothetical protein
MSPRVFVVQELTHVNISPALEFGSLLFMIGPGEHALNPQRVLDTYRQCVHEHDFRAEDYVLLIGDPVLIGCAVAVIDQWMQHKHYETPLNVLKWDREMKRYLPIEIPLAA